MDWFSSLICRRLLVGENDGRFYGLKIEKIKS